MPDLTEEQACERLDGVVEAVLWNNDSFMAWLETLARCCYSGPEDVIVRMTRLWYAYVRREIGPQEDCDCDVRRPNTSSRT